MLKVGMEATGLDLHGFNNLVRIDGSWSVHGSEAISKAQFANIVLEFRRS